MLLGGLFYLYLDQVRDFVESDLSQGQRRTSKPDRKTWDRVERQFKCCLESDMGSKMVNRIYRKQLKPSPLLFRVVQQIAFHLKFFESGPRILEFHQFRSEKLSIRYRSGALVQVHRKMSDQQRMLAKMQRVSSSLLGIRGHHEPKSEVFLSNREFISPLFCHKLLSYIRIQDTQHPTASCNSPQFTSNKWRTGRS